MKQQLEHQWLLGDSSVRREYIPAALKLFEADTEPVFIFITGWPFVGNSSTEVIQIKFLR